MLAPRMKSGLVITEDWELKLLRKDQIKQLSETVLNEYSYELETGRSFACVRRDVLPSSLHIQ